MESCFVLYLESENPPNGIVTCSVAGVLTDGQRMVLRAPTETTIGQIVKALYMTEGVDRKMIEAGQPPPRFVQVGSRHQRGGRHQICGHLQEVMVQASTLYLSEYR
jgi:stage V sporulation protein SpoVS